MRLEHSREFGGGQFFCILEIFLAGQGNTICVCIPESTQNVLALKSLVVHIGFPRISGVFGSEYLYFVFRLTVTLYAAACKYIILAVDYASDAFLIIRTAA